MSEENNQDDEIDTSQADERPFRMNVIEKAKKRKADKDIHEV